MKILKKNKKKKLPNKDFTAAKTNTQFTMDNLLAIPIEEYPAFLSDKLDGDITYLTHFFNGGYSMLVSRKDLLLDLLDRVEDSKYDETKNTINNIYVLLQLIEDRVNICNEVLKVRASSKATC